MGTRSPEANPLPPPSGSSPLVSRGETGLVGSRWLPGDYVGRDHGKPSVELGDPLSNSEGGGIGPAASVDLPIKIGNVSFNRVDGQREAMCEFRLYLALRAEAKDIELTRGEPVRVP